MSCDTDITMWKLDNILKIWPDALELFNHMYHITFITIENVKYVIASVSYTTLDNWMYDYDAEENSELDFRLEKFINWLQANSLCYIELE